MKQFFILSLSFFTVTLFAQNLNSQRIWKISSKKRSIFLDKGIFHIDKESGVTKLSSVRNSFFKSRGYERVVFDFSGNNPPRLYGHISKKKKKVYIDFFNTSLKKEIPSIKKLKFVESVDFFAIDKNQLSIEINFSKKVSYDIFYLTNPGRLVIDIQK